MRELSDQEILEIMERYDISSDHEQSLIEAGREILEKASME